MDKSSWLPNKTVYIAVVIAGITLAGVLFWDDINGLLGQKNIETGGHIVETAEGTAIVGVDMLPKNWPSDVPKYKNATVESALTSNGLQTGSSSSMVILKTTDSYQKITDFYKKELLASGWDVREIMAMEGVTSLELIKDNRKIGLQFRTENDGQVSAIFWYEI